MAVIALPVEALLRLVVVTGSTDLGDPIYKNKVFNRIRPMATEEDVHDVGQALAGLQKYPLHDIQRSVNSSLVEG